ncbi:MAG: NAD-dependent epimerase/dehydratase family protein [Bacteroidales bacterium]|nr:NAD-dependent epimerase/dehydratase family protein [Bacteroidales bacterium]
MNILVTGAAGFIGFYTAKALREAGHTVVGLDNLNTYYDLRLKEARLRESGLPAAPPYGETVSATGCAGQPSYAFVRLDMTDAAALNRLFEREKFDAVCHLAAQAGVRYSIEQPQAYIESNLIGFFNVLEACRRFSVTHLVYASSSSVYGLNDKFPYSESDTVDHPVSLYAATKKSDELMSHVYSHLHGLCTTGLRFFTVYGPWGRPDMAPMKFLKAILSGEPIKIYNHGELYRDFTYITDIVTGIVKVLESPAPAANQPRYRIYNIGRGESVRLTDFIATLETVCGRQAVKEYVGMQPGDVYRTDADTTALQRDFNYRPQVSLAEGLAKLYAWYKDFSL